jgi:hypothetical protein
MSTDFINDEDETLGDIPLDLYDEDFYDELEDDDPRYYLPDPNEEYYKDDSDYY